MIDLNACGSVCACLCVRACMHACMMYVCDDPGVGAPCGHVCMYACMHARMLRMLLSCTESVSRFQGIIAVVTMPACGTPHRRTHFTSSDRGTPVVVHTNMCIHQASGRCNCFEFGMRSARRHTCQVQEGPKIKLAAQDSVVVVNGVLA